jgi:hypothetical protein
MSDGVKELTSGALRILHGARSLPPVEAVEALRPFSELMHKEHSTEQTCRSLNRRSNGTGAKSQREPRSIERFLEEAIEATLSFVNEAR